MNIVFSLSTVVIFNSKFPPITQKFLPILTVPKQFDYNLYNPSMGVQHIKTLDFDRINHVVLENILNRNSFDKILADVYRETGLPVIAFDVSFNLISYAFERPFFIPGWEHLAENKYASEEMVLNNHYLKFEEKVLASKTSCIVYTANREELATAFGAVFHDDRLSAYVATLLMDVSTADGIRLNDLLCDAYMVSSKPTDSALDTLDVEKLLLEKSYSSTHLLQFSSMNPPPYCVALLQLSDNTRARQHYVKSRLNNRKDIFTAIDENGNIRILICCKDMSRTTLKELLEKIAYTFSGRVFYSDFFCNLTMISTAIVQCNMCINVEEILKSGSSAIFFPDIYIEALCYSVMQLNGFSEDYYLRHLKKMESLYPSKYTDYLKTLEAYIFSGLNATETAVSLSVHKNTIVYRVNSILEKLHIDSMRHEDIDMLMLELVMMHLSRNAKG